VNFGNQTLVDRKMVGIYRQLAVGIPLYQQVDEDLEMMEGGPGLMQRV
jgi:hypothetical protein